MTTEKRIKLKIDVANIIKGYANSGYDPMTALCELIDNSIGAGAEGIEIAFTYGAGNLCTKIVVTDDGMGIPYTDIDELMSPSFKKSGDSLHEHGIGMKAAIAYFGKDCIFQESFGGIESFDGTNHYLIKELVDDELIIDEYPYTRKDTGATITINVTNGSTFKTNTASGNMSIGPYLGRKYALLLENKSVKIDLSFTNASNGKDTHRKVKANHPPYVHSDGISRKPCENIKFTTPMGTEGHLIVGCFNTKLAVGDRRGWDLPKGQKGSMDIIMHDRALLMSDQSTLKGFNVTHPKYNNLIGRVVLDTPLPTLPNKTGFQPGELLDDLVKHIGELWVGNNISQKHFPDSKSSFSESVVRNSLKKFLETEVDPMTGSNIWEDVKKEEATGVNLNIDVGAKHVASSNQAVFEVKIDPISAQDVNQLVGYMIAKGRSHGYLVGPAMSDNAITQIANWKKALNSVVDIKFWDYNNEYKKIMP